MKTGMLAGGLLLLALLLAGRRDDPAPGGTEGRASGRGTGPSGETRAMQANATARPPKLSDRPADRRRATHEPEQLMEFQLPAVDIDGLDLREALGRLMGLYRDVCSETGETPLALGFELPDEAVGELRLQLGSATLDASIRFLGALAGLEVERDGTIYRFVPPEPYDGAFTRTFNVPPDFLQRVEELGDTKLMHAHSRAAGEDAVFQYFPANSTLILRTGQAGDMIATEALVEWVASSHVPAFRLEASLLTLPPGADGQFLPSGPVSEERYQAVLRELAGIDGATVFAFPGLSAHPQGSFMTDALPDLSRASLLPALTQASASQSGLSRSIRFHYAGPDSPELPAAAGAVYQQRGDGFHLSEQPGADGSRRFLAIRSATLGGGAASEQ